MVGAPPAAAGGARGGGGGGGLAGGENAGGGGLTRRRAWPMRLRASGRRRRRRAGSGEKGFANRKGSAACDGVSFGRRFWARRVGFSARSDLRPLFFAPLHSILFEKLDFIL